MPVTVQQAIEIRGSAQQIWPYIGTEAGLRRWWGMDITLEEKQGGRCEERGIFQGRACLLRGEVTVYAPPHQLVLLLRNAQHEPAWPAFTTISLTLTEANGYTVVTVDHQAFGTLPAAYPVETITSQEVRLAPVHPLILNQRPLPATARPIATSQPSTVGTALKQPLFYARDEAWHDKQAVRWANSLKNLQQMSQV